MLDVERMPQRIGIGRETETGVTDIEIDVSAWRRKWPGLTISAMHTPQGGSPYVLDTELKGDTLVWHVSDADTASTGEGQMEIIGTAEGVRKLSCVVGVVVTGRMPGTVGDAPEAAKPWADKVLAAAESVRSSAEEARESAGSAKASADAAQEAAESVMSIAKDARESADSAQASAEAAKESAEGVVTAEAERAQAEQARVQAEQARQEAEKAREEVLPSKLTEPSTGLEVGKYFRIAAIDEAGHAVLEAVDAPVGGLSTEPSLWPAWTADEQAAARERMGIPGGYERIEVITIEEEAVVQRRYAGQYRKILIIAQQEKYKMPRFRLMSGAYFWEFYDYVPYKHGIIYLLGEIEIPGVFSNVRTIAGDTGGNPTMCYPITSRLSNPASYFNGFKSDDVCKVGTTINVYGVRA